jgi:hypothetical protein
LVAASVYRGKTYQQSRALDMLICPAFRPAFDPGIDIGVDRLAGAMLEILEL